MVAPSSLTLYIYVNLFSIVISNKNKKKHIYDHQRTKPEEPSQDGQKYFFLWSTNFVAYCEFMKFNKEEIRIPHQHVWELKQMVH